VIHHKLNHPWPYLKRRQLGATRLNNLTDLLEGSGQPSWWCYKL
jgi:hypothetical protein